MVLQVNAIKNVVLIPDSTTWMLWLLGRDGTIYRISIYLVIGIAKYLIDTSQLNIDMFSQVFKETYWVSLRKIEKKNLQKFTFRSHLWKSVAGNDQTILCQTALLRMRGCVYIILGEWFTKTSLFCADTSTGSCTASLG